MKVSKCENCLEITVELGHGGHCKECHEEIYDTVFPDIPSLDEPMEFYTNQK